MLHAAPSAVVGAELAVRRHAIDREATSVDCDAKAVVNVVATIGIDPLLLLAEGGVVEPESPRVAFPARPARREAFMEEVGWGCAGAPWGVA